MSLIMDALKKAQQLRSKESKGGPFFKQGRGNRGPNKRRWIIIGGSVAGILVLLLVFLRVFLIPSTPPSQQTVRLVEIKPTLPETEKISPEVTKEAEKPAPMEEPKPSLPEVQPSPPKILKENEPAVEKRKEEKISIKPIPEKSMTRAAKKEEKAVIEEKSLSPSTLPPSSLPKEEMTPKPVALVQELGKERPLTFEVIQHFNSGVTFYHQKEMAKAIQAYQKVIEIDPNYIEAYNNLGIIYQEMGDLESALKTYRRAIEINPKYEKGLNNIGILLHLKGEDEKALEAFNKVLAINPNHIESHINLGTLYKKKGQSEKGIESYQKALVINPHHGETHYNLGLLYEQMGKTDLAIHHYQQFVLLSSGSYPELASRVNRHIAQLMKIKGGKKE